MECGKPVVVRGLSSGDRPSTHDVYSLRELEDFKPFFDDLYAACDTQGIPLESGISEYAPGQFELTLRHKPDALRATDDALMYKRLVKRSEEHTSELQSLMRISYDGYCLKKKKTQQQN